MEYIVQRASCYKRKDYTHFNNDHHYPPKNAALKVGCEILPGFFERDFLGRAILSSEFRMGSFHPSLSVEEDFFTVGSIKRGLLHVKRPKQRSRLSVLKGERGEEEEKPHDFIFHVTAKDP